MALAKLPTLKDVKDLIEGLLGRSIELNASPLWAPAPGQAAITADFVDDVGKIAAGSATTLELGIFLGAALGLIPAGGAKDMAADGELTPMVAENLFEVFNVLSSVFNTPEATHVRLGKVYTSEENPPAELSQWLAAPTGRVDFTMNIAGYGSGPFSLVSGS